MSRNNELKIVVVLVAAMLAMPIAPPSARAAPQGATTSALPRDPAKVKAKVVHPGRAGVVRFAWPATHVVWTWTGPEGAGVRFRTLRVGDSSWSSWDRAPGAHDLDEGNRHHSGLLAVDGATAVEWSRLSGKRAPRNVTLDYIDASAGPHSVLQPPPDSNDEAPTIVTRFEWGADESLKSTSGECERRFYPLQQIFVHHTAGANFDYDSFETMRAIYWYHTQRQGWCDIGYNFVIGWDGTIFEGRWAREYGPWETHASEAPNGRVVAGAHVSGYNSGSVGISLMGNFQGIDAPPEMRHSLAELIAWEADRHGLDPTAVHRYRDPDDRDSRRLPVVAGHRDAGSTACPGDRLYRALDEVRQEAAASIGSGKPSANVFAQASATSVTYGSSVTFNGRLSDENGAGLALRNLDVYERQGGAAWAVVETVMTGPDGSFSFDRAPAARAELMVSFAGDDSLWGAQSDLMTIAVKPIVSLEGEGGSPGGDGASHYPVGTPVVPLAGRISPPHPGGSIVVRVAQVHADGSRTALARARVRLDGEGHFRYEFASPIPTQGVKFRGIAWWPGDADHAPAMSPPVFFSIDS